MADKIFLDTNILVYTFDNEAAAKKKRALELLDSLYDSSEYCVSTQVIEEFWNVALRKMEPPLSEDGIRDFISSLPKERVEIINMDTINLALVIKKNHGFSFWDSMIIATAVKAGCTILYSEDMRDGSSISGVEIINPFREKYVMEFI